MEDFRVGRRSLVTLLALVLAGCGSGGDGGGKNGARTSVRISGTAYYQFVPANPGCAGLNIDNPESRPVRGATVQLLDNASGAVLGSAVSTATGGYVFDNVTVDTMVRLRLRAELKQPGTPGWDVEVRDNHLVGESDLDVPPPTALPLRALYVIDSSAFTSGASNLVRDITAATGWTGSSYDDDRRAAAPFALLDVAYQAMQFIRATDTAAHFPPLDIFWSPSNRSSSDIDITAGMIGTSSYYGEIDSLFILGDASEDTDEFDDDIVAHEWGHYFEEALSRTDSPGGAHNVGEALVAPLAFGEGWASALAAMVLDDPAYCDTRAPIPSGSALSVNAESSNFGSSGWFNELDVTRIIYDLWDSNAPGVDGVDNGSIGFSPIYEVMTGPERFTEAFTSIFTFATELRASLNAADAALLDALLAQDNIVSGPDLDIWATNESNDAGVPASVQATVLPLYLDYTAGDSPIEVCVNSYLDGLSRDGNNPGQDRFLRIAVPFDDQYDVSMVTTTPLPPDDPMDESDQSDPDIYIVRGSAGGEEVASGITPTPNVEPTFRTPTLLASETYIARLEEWRFDDPDTPGSYPQEICFDVSLASTP